jgi:hypothetical protein
MLLIFKCELNIKGICIKPEQCAANNLIGYYQKNAGFESRRGYNLFCCSSIYDSSHQPLQAAGKGTNQ